MIWSSFPWWDMLHAWWSEHPKYAFQVHTNLMSGVEHIISNFDQAILPQSDAQAIDEDVPDVVAPALPLSIQESYFSLSLPLQSPIPLPTAPFPFIKAQHPHVNSPLPPQVNSALNLDSLLMMDILLPSLNSTPAFDPSLNMPLPSLNTPVTCASSPFQRDMQLPDARIKLDVEDVLSLITPSSCPSVKSTPGLKSVAEPSTWPSSCAGPKNCQKDFMASWLTSMKQHDLTMSKLTRR